MIDESKNKKLICIKPKNHELCEPIITALNEPINKELTPNEDNSLCKSSTKKKVIAIKLKPITLTSCQNVIDTLVGHQSNDTHASSITITNSAYLNDMNISDTTKVVNVKVKYIRPKYADLKEWMNDPQNVYIGRRGVVFIDGMRYPKQDSIWANPYKIGKDGDRKEVINRYKNHINFLIESNQITKQQLFNLNGKTLGCWCKPDLCHGDILVQLISNFSQ